MRLLLRELQHQREACCFPRAAAKAGHDALVPRTAQCLADRHVSLQLNTRAAATCRIRTERV